MSNPFNITDSLWDTFISYMFGSGQISIPTDFHGQCASIYEMLSNDSSGIISTLIDYSINSASEAKFSVESSNETLENLLDVWLGRINININGVPTGLQELAKEYYKEIWAGSSLCLLKVSDWKTIKVGNNEIYAPTTLWFHNGGAAYIKRPNPKNYKLGTDEYYQDEKTTKSIVPSKGDLIIQKYGSSRWFAKYPIPYLVRKGVLKNFLAIQELQSKGDEVISKNLPYLLQLIKGTEGSFLKGKGIKTEDLENMRTTLKTKLKRYKKEGKEVPIATTPFDEEFKHIIPDLLPMLREELFRQGYRALLAGLGFVDLLEIAQSRQETRLNPKPFIAEVNAGVEGFKSILKEIIFLIIKENKEYHKKFFSDNVTLNITNTPLRINLDQLRDLFRSGFVYGAVTFQTFHESLGIDHEQEIERMKKEWDSGLRELFYAHIISNQEDKGIDTDISKPPITKKEIEKTKEKEKGELKDNLEEAPYKNLDELPKYIKKMTVKCQETFMATFNSVYEETKDEGKAFAIAINSAKRCMHKSGYVYDKETKTWKKKE